MLSPARALLLRSARSSLTLTVSRRAALSTSTSTSTSTSQAAPGQPPAASTLSSKQNGLTQPPRNRLNITRQDSESLPRIQATWRHRTIVLQQPGEIQKTIISAATIRDNCCCSACRNPSSGQKSFATPQISNTIYIKSVRQTAEGLAVSLRNALNAEPNSLGEHETVLTWQQIELAMGAQQRNELDVPPPKVHNVLRRTGVVHWDKEILAQQVRKIDYEEYMQGGEAFWDAVIDICRFGIVFLKNVPRDEDSVIKITTQIANIRETFYGRTFDVVAKPNAENVAYTSGYLGLHQDLLYLAPPPKIQILHCMDNSCEGGESLFSDGDRIGRLLTTFAGSEHDINTLATTVIRYAYDKNGYNYEHYRPLINLDANGEYRNVFWSPPFQGLVHPTWNMKPWLVPARFFEQLINDEAAVYKAKMQPGECVLFDNLRVMHGRTAFDSAGGSRWLRGAYIAEEDFLSKATHIPREQAEKYRGPTPWEAQAAEEELQQSKWYWPIKETVERLRSLRRGLPRSAKD